MHSRANHSKLALSPYSCMLQHIMTLFLVDLSLDLLILGFLIPLSSQRSLPNPPQRNKNYVSNQSIEIPIFSTGMTSSKVLLVPIQLGEPPQTLYLIPDTGSDATWVYCDHLPRRYKNDFSKPIFSYSLSSTFAPVYCSSPLCSGTNQCSSTQDLCNYTHEYVDGTATTGYWATDTVTIKSDKRRLDLKFHGMMFGCSSQDFINLSDADGILGLSPNHPSFTSHLAPKFGYMFSYFLASNKGVSNKNLLVFGRTEISGLSFDPEQMQYTKLIQTNSFFHVEVSGLLFDDVLLLDIPKWVWKFDAENESSGVILDTGTTFTYVPEVAFQAIHALFAEFFQPYNNVTVTNSDVCFNSLAAEFDGIHFPRMAFEFEDGARFVPHEENLFYEDEVGSSCLAIQAIDRSDGSIIGSNFQTGYFWEYDLLNQKVGFAPLV